MSRPDNAARQGQRPARRMSVFTASQTLRTADGWSLRTRSLRRDSRRGSLLRRDSVRTEGSSLQPAKPLVRLENTYRVGPDDDGHFKAGKVQRAIEDLLQEQLAGKTYDRTEAAVWSLQLASILKQFCKDLGCPRYKLVAHVVVGQNQDTALQSASRCLWNDHLDSFACGTFKNDSIFAIATVFAIYYE